MFYFCVAMSFSQFVISMVEASLLTVREVWGDSGESRGRLGVIHGPSLKQLTHVGHSLQQTAEIPRGRPL